MGNQKIIALFVSALMEFYRGKNKKNKHEEIYFAADRETHDNLAAYKKKSGYPDKVVYFMGDTRHLFRNSPIVVQEGWDYPKVEVRVKPEPKRGTVIK